MNFNFNEGINYTFESLNILQSMANGDDIHHTLDTFHKKYGVSLDELSPKFSPIIEVYDYISSKISIPKDRLEYLFKNFSHSIDRNLAHIIFLNGISIDTDFSKFTKEEKHKLIVTSIACFIDEENDLDSLISSLNSDKEVFNYISSQDLDHEIKYTLVYIYYNYDELFYEISTFARKITMLIKEKEYLLNDILESFKNQFFLDAAHDIYGYLKKNYQISIKNSDSINIHPNIFHFNEVRVYGPWKNEKIALGINFLNTLDLIKKYKIDETRLLDVLKVLSNKSKLEILKSLNSQKLYGSQIAEMLNLTSATVSYHMSALANLQLILVDKDNNKVFYTLNKDKLKEYFATLENLFF
ncbi:MAG: winged helix-turn-helix domain-containing protein [Clostridium sp.]|uniref:ArsR/SmtB family transcription factor n=1 Tax=Clostridium sp. TaxID=1506 RepID=UPI002A87E03A|nr:winged helix-turn-helix domain-containing protein [Clostridium sp.]MDY5099302.1 winged helix-turn-helix domain-containing protein [Clostridium sp.]